VGLTGVTPKTRTGSRAYPIIEAGVRVPAAGKVLPAERPALQHPVGPKIDSARSNSDPTALAQLAEKGGWQGTSDRRL